MIPPPKNPSKLLQSKEEICQAFQMGEKRLEKWKDRGLPIKIVDGRWMGHYDAIDEFIKSFLESSAS